MGLIKLAKMKKLDAGSVLNIRAAIDQNALNQNPVMAHIQKGAYDV
jgi:hypothetical protein